ncbi:MAG: ANTAR domain-containing protein [Oscillospiraceae bacterium]|nr:ANTAR domain-containing protein [Oscillospiraceae bacterium]
MESALIVSCTEKSTVYITELLNAASVKHIAVLPSCGEARRLLLERDFDLVIINAPLRDESGESLSRHIASKSLSQVILVVKSEFFEAVSAVCEGDGVLTVSKPVNRAVFWSALTLAKAACGRLRRIQAENARLKQKIEDIRVIDRAKCILISFMSMSEQDAHRYIEKQAMDMRATKRVIAEGILKTYES